MTHALIGAAFIAAIVTLPSLALIRFERRRAARRYTSSPEGARLALLIEEAYLQGRISLRDTIYVHSTVHPSGARVPNRIYSTDELADALADEAAKYIGEAS